MPNHDVSVTEHKLKATLVGDIMSRLPITVNEDMPLADAAHYLTKFRISGIPVVNAKGNVIGMLTLTDFLGLFKKVLRDVEKKKDPAPKLGAKVEALMSRVVFSIREDQTLYDAMKLMDKKNIHTLPVMREDRMVGVVGRRDILQEIYRV